MGLSFQRTVLFGYIIRVKKDTNFNSSKARFTIALVSYLLVSDKRIANEWVGRSLTT